MSNSTAVLLALLTTIFLHVLKGKRCRYRSIPGPKPSSILGYRLDVINPDGFEWHAKMTQEYGHVVRLEGHVFQDDGLFVSDPRALQSILIRDQRLFDEAEELRGIFGVIHRGTNVSTVPVSGKQHKILRRIIDPALTVANISRLLPVFYEIAHQFIDSVDDAVNKGAREVDIIQFISRTTLEFIGRGGLGHSFRSFDQDSTDYIIFHSAIHALLPTMARLFLVIPFFESWRNIRPDNLRKTLYTLVGYLPWPSARKFKYLIDTMHLTYHTIYESKKEAYEKGLLDDDVKDMPSLSLQANSTLPLDAKFTDQLVISSMSVLTLGGQETTTGALTRHILMLATHTSVQERLRAELQDSNKASLGRELSYEELHKLPYLDSVVREVLRLYPPVPFLWKTTKQDTIVPLEFPIQQKERGSIIKKIVIAKGTTVCIGIAAANRSIQVYGSDALEFKPERWLGLDKGQVKTYGVYSNTFTFLAGSRACPGMKFALTEIKMILSVLLLRYSLSLSTDEIEWKMGGITFTPYLKGDDVHPCAPIRLTRL